MDLTAICHNFALDFTAKHCRFEMAIFCVKGKLCDNDLIALYIPVNWIDLQTNSVEYIIQNVSNFSSNLDF